MKKVFFIVAFALAIFVAPPGSFAQQKFNLQNKNNHYYFSTTVGGAKADVMLESGIPAMLVNRDFYEKNLKNSGLDFKTSEGKMQLLNKVYPISFRAEGKVSVGSLVFDGPIFILEDFSGISMPIQYLKMADAKKTFISIDFQGNTMSVSGEEPNVQGEKYKLRIDKKMGFPIVSSTLTMNTETGNAKLKGDFIVDFGNPELLFLMQQHKGVAKILKGEKVKLLDIINGETYEVIGTAIMTESTTVCGRTFERKTIAITDKMPAIEQLGFLGVPFFQKTVVFDFAGGRMIVQ